MSSPGRVEREFMSGCRGCMDSKMKSCSKTERPGSEHRTASMFAFQRASTPGFGQAHLGPKQPPFRTRRSSWTAAQRGGA